MFKMQSELLQLHNILYAATREDWLFAVDSIPERHRDFAEFGRRAELGDFDPVDFEHENPEDLAEGREPLGPVEFDYRRDMMFWRMGRSCDRGRVAQLAMGVALGLLDRFTSGVDGIEPVKREIETLAMMQGLSDEDCSVLLSAFEQFFARVMPVVSRAGAAPELDTLAIQAERAEYKAAYEAFRSEGLDRDAKAVAAALAAAGSNQAALVAEGSGDAALATMEGVPQEYAAPGMGAGAQVPWSERIYGPGPGTAVEEEPEGEGDDGFDCGCEPEDYTGECEPAF